MFAHDCKSLSSELTLCDLPVQMFVLILFTTNLIAVVLLMHCKTTKIPKQKIKSETFNTIQIISNSQVTIVLRKLFVTHDRLQVHLSTVLCLTIHKSIVEGKVNLMIDCKNETVTIIGKTTKINEINNSQITSDRKNKYREANKGESVI